MGELEEQIKVVAGARKERDSCQAAKNVILAKWEGENKRLLDRLEITKQEVTIAEEELRELTLQVFAETGNKAPAVGVGIRVRTILGYLSSDAMSWAMEHKLALKLDSSAFEKIAKTSNLPFVTISEEPQATIATNLDEILPPKE